MGKSPGKWIKTVFLGKKYQKSNLSKDANGKKASVTTKTQLEDLDVDSMVISNPIPQVVDTTGANREVEDLTDNLTSDVGADERVTLGLNATDDAELSRQEQAATKVQAAFRGYLARRAFWTLKGIIRLQALVRGHLVRRQAIATLRCMRAIVEFQALVRGRRVRLSGLGRQVSEPHTPVELLDKKRDDLLGKSLKLEKLSTYKFVAKLLASLPTTRPLSIQYEPIEANSAWRWVELWSNSRFWEPLGRPKKSIDAKPKRKQAKLQNEDKEAGRPKRSVRRIPAVNGENNLSHSSENEKPKRNMRKTQNHYAEPVQEQPHNELEKVKRNLRKISVCSERSEPATDKPQTGVEKAYPIPDVSEQVMEQNIEKIIDSTTDQNIEKVTDSTTDQNVEKVSDSAVDQNIEEVSDSAVVVVPKYSEPIEPAISHAEEKPVDAPNEDLPAVEVCSLGSNGKVENGLTLSEELSSKEERSGKENHKARRRKSLSSKQEYPESVVQNSPTLPSYMAATESVKAKLRAQGSPKILEEGVENGFTRRHSLPSPVTKLSLQSPRIQKPLQVNGKGGSGGNKSTKSLISPKDEKVLQTGWRR